MSIVAPKAIPAGTEVTLNINGCIVEGSGYVLEKKQKPQKFFSSAAWTGRDNDSEPHPESPIAILERHVVDWLLTESPGAHNVYLHCENKENRKSDADPAHVFWALREGYVRYHQVYYAKGGSDISSIAFKLTDKGRDLVKAHAPRNPFKTGDRVCSATLPHYAKMGEYTPGLVIWKKDDQMAVQWVNNELSVGHFSKFKRW